MAVPEAVVDAGRVRLRPIVMTTATTVLGLVPMAIGLGDGAALRQPLAIAIIGGLTLATALTLLVIPCAYSLVPGRVRAAWRARSFSEPLLQGTGPALPKSELSPRLRAVADLVLPGRAIADIGTDHALVPAWLLAAGTVPRAIASDVGEGPLEAARRQLGGSPVELRRGDGLHVLDPGEVGTVVIAGMGGAKVRGIVDASPEVVAELERLVLQPNTEWTQTRRWIAEHRFALEDEVLVEDRGKFYVVFAVRPLAGDDSGFTEADLELGPILRRRGGATFEAWLAAERDRLATALAGIEAHGDPESDAARALRTRLRLLANGDKSI
jgi:tRNA (adenine22-N1)-methyltransferase